MRASAVLLLGICLTTVGLAGCLTPGPGDRPAPGPLAFETIAKGQVSGIFDPRSEVIRSFGAWQQLWTEHDAGEDGASIPVPEVDFSKKMVIAVFHGQAGNTCYDVEIDELILTADGPLRVDATTYVPAEDAVCGEALTQPFHIVSTQAIDAEVSFAFSQATRGGQEEGNQTDDPDEPSSTNVTFETVDKGGDSGIVDRQERVVRDDASWQQLWEDHTAGQEPQPESPEVDLSSEIVVAIFKGQSPDGCHGSEITNVTLETQENGTTELLVEGSYYRIEGAYCSQEITYPFHIVEVEAQPDEVTFQISEDERQA